MRNILKCDIPARRNGAEMPRSYCTCKLERSASLQFVEKIDHTVCSHVCSVGTVRLLY